MNKHEKCLDKCQIRVHALEIGASCHLPTSGQFKYADRKFFIVPFCLYSVRFFHFISSMHVHTHIHIYTHSQNLDCGSGCSGRSYFLYYFK